MTETKAPLKTDPQAVNNLFETGTKVIFVGGSQRSGTTLLRTILDSHPDIAGGPEFAISHKIAEIWEFGKRRITFGPTGTYTDVQSYRELLKGLLSDLLDPYRRSKGKKHIAEKTPKNVVAFADLHDLIPDAYFVHIIRDGRDVIASMMQVSRTARKRGTEVPGLVRNLEKSCMTWRKYVSAPSRAQKDGGQAGFNNQYIEVHYEDLVAEPEKNIRTLCDRLGVEFSADMVSPETLPHDKGILGNWGTQEKMYRSIHGTSIGRWRKDFSFLERLVISVYCQPLLVRLGYADDRKWLFARFEGPAVRVRDALLLLRLSFRLVDKVWRKVRDTVIELSNRSV